VLGRRNLIRVLSRLLTDSGLEASVRRVYWYTDRPDGQLIDDQITRVVRIDVQPGGEGEVADPDDDGLAVGSWQAIDADLKALARSQAFEMILIGSDDERLVASINEAQLGGVSVAMLADDSVSDYASLAVEEPEWAALLAQADRRVVVRSPDLIDLRGGMRSGSDDGDADNFSAEQALIEEVVRAWWADQNEDAREYLRAALQLSPGIPQEVDRALLLQSRERFVRPLSFNEKKLMRECLREVVASSDLAEDEEASLA